jgi:hypothetical protein
MQLQKGLSSSRKRGLLGSKKKRKKKCESIKLVENKGGAVVLKSICLVITSI